MTDAPQPTLTERVASAAAWNTLLFPARFVVGLAASVLLFRALTLAEYGVLTLLTGLAATIGLYSDLGIERSLPRFIPEVERQGGRAGVARFLGRIIALKLLIVLICTAALLLFSTPLIGYVADRERGTLAQAEQQVATLQAQGAPLSEIARAEQERDAQASVIEQIETRGQLFLWAVGALVQSWWLSGRASAALIAHTARVIEHWQQRNATARRCHRRRTLRKLRQNDIILKDLIRCRWP